MIALIDLDFADNQSFDQFLMLLLLMQQVQEQRETRFELEALHFGRRADNTPQFMDRRPIPDFSMTER